MGTYEDAREKTRNNLVNAFWDLYCEKDINKITIKEITDRAGYNRATFYIYFKNVQQVLDYVESRLYKQMQMGNSYSPPSFEQAQEHLQQAILQLDENRRFLCVLLSENGDPRFAKAFHEHFRRMATRLIEEGHVEATVPLDFALDFMIGGIVNCLQQWYTNPSGQSAKDLIEKLFHIAFHGMLRLPDGKEMNCLSHS